YNQGQSLKPDAPYTTSPVKLTSVFDFAGKRGHLEAKSEFQGPIPIHSLSILKGESGSAVNLITHVATPFAPAGLTAAKTTLRRDPAVLLLTALGRADTLRSLGPAAITFADSEGTQIALSFDPQTHLLTKYETLADNPVLGDV